MYSLFEVQLPPPRIIPRPIAHTRTPKLGDQDPDGSHTWPAIPKATQVADQDSGAAGFTGRLYCAVTAGRNPFSRRTQEARSRETPPPRSLRKFVPRYSLKREQIRSCNSAWTPDLDASSQICHKALSEAQLQSLFHEGNGAHMSYGQDSLYET